MAISRKVLVELPDKRIYIRHTGQYPYVYKVLRAYRNEKGQPTNNSVLIGKIDTLTGKLIPNDNYWKYYTEEDAATAITNNFQIITEKFDTKSIGVSFFIEKLLDKSKILSLILEIFGEERTDKMLTAIIYMATEGNVFERVEYWCSEHMLHDPGLTSASASVFFASITLNERLMFFKRWIVLIQRDDDYLAYDATSFSTYAKNISDAGFGYNRDRESLPQINMGCYFGEKCMLPLFYVTYAGAITDKKHFQSMMKYNDDLGVKSPKFVMDKGFCSTENLKFLRSWVMS